MCTLLSIIEQEITDRKAATNLAYRMRAPGTLPVVSIGVELEVQSLEPLLQEVVRVRAQRVAHVRDSKPLIRLNHPSVVRVREEGGAEGGMGKKMK